MSAAHCKRCEAKTRTTDENACVVCGTPRPVNEAPDPELEEAGQVPLFPLDQLVS